MTRWRLEDDVDDWVKGEFARIGLQKLSDYNTQSSMSAHMRASLLGGSKTRNQTSVAGIPDFSCEKYSDLITVIGENKLGSKKHLAERAGDIRDDQQSIASFAVNGAIHYARKMIASKKYHEVIAIGVSGDSADNIQVSVYYVFDAVSAPKLSHYTTLDFLESRDSMQKFLDDIKLTEKEKHRVLIDSRSNLQRYAKELNVLMHNHAISAPQRVLYVSGMLLSMQDLMVNDKVEKPGLSPDDLTGSTLEGQHDGEKIVAHIKNYLDLKQIPPAKANLMLASFSELSKDKDRDIPIELDKLVGRLLNGEASVSKQIFTYLHENIYKSIDAMSGHLDIMGEMYSEFLKYALGDGGELGIVLTPPYVTKMMTEILGINEDSHVMDLATGSAGFLISAMETMIQEVERKYGKGTTAANEKIDHIKRHQLLGVELNAEMFTLASTNMILRGDGLGNIQKGSSFDRPPEMYAEFSADRLLLNPPFSFRENGMPFIEFGIRHMKIGGKAAIIIQDSAGSGKGVDSIKKILKENQLVASIKMPLDLFLPMAGVQTSIYILEHTGRPHDTKQKVRFIDFRNDGYKRTKRSIQEADSPIERYQDIVQIYKNGKEAVVHEGLWDLDQIVVMDEITLDGKDWNFEAHHIIDTKPVDEDFQRVVSDYLIWEISRVLKAEDNE